MKRKKFVYDRRVHHSYVFVAGNKVYTVIVVSLADELTFTRVGYVLPASFLFPDNGMAEVYFDVFDGMNGLADFRHVSFEGLGSAIVLQTVLLSPNRALGGFVF